MSEVRGIIVNEYEGGVLAIDSGQWRERMAACYLLERAGELAIIEAGANASVPRLLAVLEQRGLDRQAVRYLIVTHVHLDHAGGAGSLMQALPAAELLVHPRGARHLVDPAQLEASVRQVYGDAVFDADYGQLVPVPAGRVRSMTDGESVELGGSRLLFRDSPGHARHHFCVWDETTRGWFSGDAFGLSYRELDTEAGPFIFPTTTPVQFDPPAMRATIAMLMQAQPERIYFTHYGCVPATAELAARLLAGVDRLVAIAEDHRAEPDRSGRIRTVMLDWLMQAARAHGVSLPDADLQAILKGDVELNSQGLEYWLAHG